MRSWILWKRTQGRRCGRSRDRKCSDMPKNPRTHNFAGWLVKKGELKKEKRRTRQRALEIQDPYVIIDQKQVFLFISVRNQNVHEVRTGLTINMNLKHRKNPSRQPEDNPKSVYQQFGL